MVAYLRCIRLLSGICVFVDVCRVLWGRHMRLCAYWGDICVCAHAIVPCVCVLCGCIFETVCFNVICWGGRVSCGVTY